jgi:hypothetical protein
MVRRKEEAVNKEKGISEKNRKKGKEMKEN